MLDRLETDDLALAAVFGAVSVPWTYGFLALDVPLWPAFVASATYYAAGGGRDGLVRGYASNLAGILYAAATLWIAGALGGGTPVLAVVVGGFMFLASLHAAVPPLSFLPGGFFGYATAFSVHEAGRTVLVPGLAGETAATAIAMLVGALIGIGTDAASDRLG